MARVQFNQVLPKGCGMDIHKEVVYATISDGVREETREYNTFTSSLTQLRDWLVSSNVEYVAMESTGVYWKPIYNVFEGYIKNIWIVNARHIKNVPGHKTDVNDSVWITKLLLAGLLKPSFIPPKEQRELRDLTRYRRKLIEFRSANKNRVIRTLEDGNIKLSTVLTDTNGKTANSLIEMVCSGEELTESKIEGIRHKRCHHTAEEMLEACTGYMTSHKIFMLQSIRGFNDIISEQIVQLDNEIKTKLLPYQEIIKKLCAIPGVQNRICEELIAEIGLDMTTFPSSAHLCSWAGMCPGNNESAGKKKSSHTNHGNKQVRATLVEAAWAATRTKDTFYQERFSRLSIKKGNKRALIAIGHSILTTVYHILTTGEEYKELGKDHYKVRTENKKKSYLVSELKKLGYKVQIAKES